MTFQPNQQAYAVAAGTTSTNTIYIQGRNPTSADVIGTTGPFKLGQFWLNPVNESLWYLNGQSSSGGVLISDWIAIEGAFNTVTGDDGVIISPVSGNIDIDGEVVANATHAKAVFTKSGGAGTMDIDVQVAAAIAAGDITKVGLASFNSAQFTVTNGFVSTSGSGTLSTLTGNTGGAISPTAGNINTVGTGSITIAGSGSTLTTQLTGLTNHAVLVGAGTATITNVGPTATAGQVLQSAGAAADPAFSTATYPSTTTVSQILYSSATNVVSGLTTANNATVTTGATGIPVLTSFTTNGSLLIGSGSGVPLIGTLTAGTGISITNAANSITIASTGSGLNWTDVTGATQTIAVENGYLTDRGGGVTYTLPATASIGDQFKIVGKLGLATITPNANQKLLIGSASGTVGVTGTAVSNNVGDCISFICIVSGSSTFWRADSVIGTWTLS